VAANGGSVYIRIMQIKLRIRRQNRSTFGGTPRQLRCHPARSGEFVNLDAFTLERVVNQHFLYSPYDIRTSKTALWVQRA